MGSDPPPQQLVSTVLVGETNRLPVDESSSSLWLSKEWRLPLVRVMVRGLLFQRSELDAAMIFLTVFIRKLYQFLRR